MPMANRKLNSSSVVNIEDLRLLAQRRVPRSVFDYLDGGADAEVTLAENCRAFRDATFRPRNGVAAYNCKTSVSVLGQEIAFPAILAPVSYIRLMHPDGEPGVARAAGQAGTVLCFADHLRPHNGGCQGRRHRSALVPVVSDWRPRGGRGRH